MSIKDWAKKVGATCLEWVEKIIKYIEDDREKQREKIRQKRRKYFDELQKQREREEKERAALEIKRCQGKELRLRRMFTTIEEYQKIIGPDGKKLDEMPDSEKEVVLHRLNELRENDENFAKAYKNYQKQLIEKRKEEKKDSADIVILDPEIAKKVRANKKDINI